MNILFATSSFNGGGITAYAHEVISSYSQDNEMSVLIGDDSKLPIKIPNVKVYRYECKNISIVNALQVCDLINNEIKPDIILSSNAHVISLIAPFLSDDIKIITVSHSLRYIESDIAAFNNKYINNIIALSHYNKEYLERQFKITDKDKVKVIYNFVRDQPQSKTIRENKKKCQTLSIVYPGGGAPTKSPDIVCKVLKRLLQTDLDFRFYWLGHTSPPLKRFQRIKNINELFPTDSRVIFTGRLPRNKAEEIISSANIVLSPSRREGCPIALLEAMRVGCIPIVSDYENANRELIRNNENGYIIQHKDIDKFVDKILDILKHHGKYSDIYEQSFKTFEDVLSFNAWKNNMDIIIQNSTQENKCRFKKFNRVKYLKDCLKLRLIKYYDLIHMICSENIVSGIIIYKESHKRK